MLLITSWSFYVFVIFLVMIYYMMPTKYQRWVLLVASCIFYWSYSRSLIWSILVATIVTWKVALALQGLHEKEKIELSNEAEDRKTIKEKYVSKRKKLVVIHIAICLGLLVFFKFSYKFVLAIGCSSTFFETLVAPVGISFYTLQALGYIIDVYRGKQEAERSLSKIALFLLYFPQTIQGPISRFKQLSDELFREHRPSYKNLTFGAQRIVWGLFKKWVIADRASIFVSEVFTNYLQYGSIEIIIATVLFTFQIYCDFSGGMDIIMGVSEILDIHLVENFKRPLFSKTISEYWRRWHVTLGSWFREYLFYPMALSKASNRLGKLLTKKVSRWAGKWIPSYIALIILWTTNGVWRGAGIQYLLYGFYYGVLMVLSMVFEDTAAKIISKFNIKTDCFSWKLWQVARTFFITVFGRLLYKSVSLEAFGVMVVKVFTEFNWQVIFGGKLLELGLDGKELIVLCAGIIILLFAEMLQRSGSVREKLANQNIVFRWVVLYGAVLFVMIFGWYGSGLQTADFIYFKY